MRLDRVLGYHLYYPSPRRPSPRYGHCRLSRWTSASGGKLPLDAKQWNGRRAPKPAISSSMWLNGTSSAGFLTAAPLNSGRSRCDRVSIDWLSDIDDLPGNHNDPRYGGR